MVTKGWYTCPACHKDLQKIGPRSILHETPVYCRKCKVEWFPAIYFGRELGEDEPFPLKIEE